MYFYTNASPDAPKLNNVWGDFNAVINYIIDGGKQYKTVKIEPVIGKEGTINVYFEAGKDLNFMQYQTIVITGSPITAYNNKPLFIESVNTSLNYYVCTNSTLSNSLGVDDTANIKHGIYHSGIERKFGGVADKRTVIRFKKGMEYRIDDRDWRPLVTPPVTVNATNENWLKFTRISMSSNYDGLDSSSGRMYPFDNTRPTLNFNPIGKYIGTQSYILWNDVSSLYYPIQSSSAKREVHYKIFADSESIVIILQQSSNDNNKYVYSFGEFEQLNPNYKNGFLFCKADTTKGYSTYDSSSFPTIYPYEPASNYLFTQDSSENLPEGLFQTSITSLLYDGGNGTHVSMVRRPEFSMSADASGLDNSTALRNTNFINGGTYFSDVIVHGTGRAGDKILFGKLKNFKWANSNLRGLAGIDGKIYEIDNEYYYSYNHLFSSSATIYTTNLIKLTRG